MLVLVQVLVLVLGEGSLVLDLGGGPRVWRLVLEEEVRLGGLERQRVRWGRGALRSHSGVRRPEEDLRVGG